MELFISYVEYKQKIILNVWNQLILQPSYIPHIKSTLVICKTGTRIYITSATDVQSLEIFISWSLILTTRMYENIIFIVWHTFYERSPLIVQVKGLNTNVHLISEKYYILLIQSSMFTLETFHSNEETIQQAINTVRKHCVNSPTP